MEEITFESYTRQLGTLLGFPPCCVQAFIEHKSARTPTPLFGSGYRPCEECSKREDFQPLIEEINQRRVKDIYPFTATPPTLYLLVHIKDGVISVSHTSSKGKFSEWLQTEARVNSSKVSDFRKNLERKQNSFLANR